MTEAKCTEIDYTQDDVWQCTHQYYKALRDEAPVHRANDVDGTPMYIVTRFQEVRAALLDKRFSKDPKTAFELGKADPVTVNGLSEGVYRKRDGGTMIRSHLLNSDPPKHSRLRAYLGATFSPQRLAPAGDTIQRILDDRLDQIDPDSEVELIEGLLTPVVVEVICTILGVPTGITSEIRRWTTAIAFTPANKAEARQGQEALIEMRSYFRNLIEELQPRVDLEVAADDQPDLLHALISGRIKGGALSTDELVEMIELLLIAGHETTINLMANGILALLDNPVQFEQLLADPSLLKPTIEEVVRYEGPVYHGTFRIASEEVDLGGVTIPEGSIVSLMFGAANRDERAFSDPDTFDVKRTDNSHLGFGQGVHFCMGAGLARLEARHILGTLFRQFPNMRLACPREEISWEAPAFGHTLQALPLRLNG